MTRRRHLMNTTRPSESMQLDDIVELENDSYLLHDGMPASSRSAACTKTDSDDGDDVYR
jgi:hypothetical protein